MAIILITGLPGHGKGIFSLDKINELEQASGRPVYYHNVKDLTLKWHQLDDPKQWFNLPEGAVILFDEAWQTFPLRPNAQTPPEYVAQLATHRHKGYDIYIVTQQPSQLDTFVRKLIDKHYHVVRKFGAEKANVHEFVGLNPNPQLTRKNSIKHSYSYPKKVYEWYKSAEIHTVQVKRPMRIYFLWFGVPLLIVAAVFFTNRILNPVNGDVAKNIKDQTTAQTQNGTIKPAQLGHVEQVQNLTYAQSHEPEIKDLPHTAIAYREIVKPVTAPYPAACVYSKSKGCKCFTQQGTNFTTDQLTCLNIVNNGVFIDWKTSTEASSGTNSGDGVQPHVDQRSNAVTDESTRYLQPTIPSS
jgi:zona occludens toxin